MSLMDGGNHPMVDRFDAAFPAFDPMPGSDGTKSCIASTAGFVMFSASLVLFSMAACAVDIDVFASSFLVC